ncbi:QWRF family [Forsythia ovata]|uniref:QWRF family n=1 Tax=Forsythia ovata TaxID=205694 RepID=A0ABD1RL61_9LAMI
MNVMVQKTLCRVWRTIVDLRDSVIGKRIGIHQLRVKLKLCKVLNNQITVFIIGSMEMETSTATVREEEDQKAETDLNENKLRIKNVKNMAKNKKKKSKFHFIPKLGCMRLNDEAVVEKHDGDGSFDLG